MIYIVTSGSYSDYKIHSVFTDKAIAEAYINAFTFAYDDASIEEFEENLFAEQLKNRYIAFKINMDIDGNVLKIEKCNDYVLTNENKPYHISGTVYVDYLKRIDVLNLDMSVLAKDEQHAIKIVNEKRGQLIAANLFH